MNFHVLYRVNPATGNDERYFRLKESFRDATGNVRNRTILTVGFDMNDIPMEDVRQVAVGLTELYDNPGRRETFFGDMLSAYPSHVRQYILKYWHQIVDKGRLDVVRKAKEESRRKAERLVDVDTVKHTDAREVGAEWICLQAIRELKLDRFLKSEGWSEVQINTALAHLITRTVYSPSELKSMIMRENSAVCELLSGGQDWQPSYHHIYKVAPSLYELKEKLETHLCNTTDTLFNLSDTIAIFDLTNFYFEGRKEGSLKAQFGRSKEKRRDCRLLVLALCINREGFIRYSSILAGNTADTKPLPNMVDALASKSGVPATPDKKTLVVMDAGIATEDNLTLIKEKGYDYLCVSRSRLSGYELSQDMKSVTVQDSRRREITLTRVRHDEGGDHYLQIKSPTKALKEESMNRTSSRDSRRNSPRQGNLSGRKAGRRHTKGS